MSRRLELVRRTRPNRDHSGWVWAMRTLVASGRNGRGIKVHRARTAAAVALLVGLGTLITTPSIASAHRPAVRAEQIAMIYHGSSRYYGGGSENEPKLSAASVLRGGHFDRREGIPMGSVELQQLRDRTGPPAAVPCR